MPEQLSLNLDAAATRLPRTLRPMLARTGTAPFDSPDHLFEPSWGGVRVLAFVEADAARDAGEPVLARLLAEDGRDLAPLFPELAGVAGLVAASSAVLDGEVVLADTSGRGDRPGLEARLAGRVGPDVTLLVFDVLYREGRSLLAEPLERRRAVLRRLLRPGDQAVVVPAIVAEGRALHAAVEEAGLEGVMARVRRSPYLPGVRSALWTFVARRSQAMGAGAAGASGALAVSPPEGPAPRSPVLALIRRLPLDDSDAEPRPGPGHGGAG